MIKLEELRNNYQEIISNDKLHIDAKFTQEQRESEIYKLYIEISNSRDFSSTWYNE